MTKNRYILILLLFLAMAVQAQEQKKVYPSFLTKDDVPNGVNYLPAPPDTASTLFHNDFAQYQWGKSIRNTERGTQAAADADMDTEKMLARILSDTGVVLNNDIAPATVKLCAYVVSDACNGTSKAKKYYMRKRPYVQFQEPTLIPEEEASHVHSGSFPSSHTAGGWAMTLMLTELLPQYQDVILHNGYEYGQSRVIAGYHYQSDVDAARLVASAVVARLHADKGFKRQLKKSQKELKKLSK